jgi:hypothetical protein
MTLMSGLAFFFKNAWLIRYISSLRTRRLHAILLNESQLSAESFNDKPKATVESLGNSTFPLTPSASR